MKNKKRYIGLAMAFAVVGLVITLGTVMHFHATKLERNFTKLAREYYEGEPKEYASDLIDHLGYFMVSLNDLKGMNVDISDFEAKSCDLTDTYGKFTFKEDDSYDIEVHLACEK